MSVMTEIEEVTMDGFQVVSSGMFMHLPRKTDATCTLWPTRISFSRLALQQLQNPEYIRIQVNPTNKCLLVVPVPSSDKDAIRWVKGQKEKWVRNMESKQFGDQLYQSWGLDPDLNYRSIGRLVTANKKIMLLFDFNNSETWRTKKGDDGNK